MVNKMTEPTFAEIVKLQMHLNTYNKMLENSIFHAKKEISIKQYLPNLRIIYKQPLMR